MKIYDKYLITEKYSLSEGITASKSLIKIKKAIEDASTPIEIRLVKAMIVRFIKKFKDEYTDNVSLEINNLLNDAERRIKHSYNG